MCECKHRWAIRNGSPALLGDLDSKSQEVFCLKCGKTVNDLLDEKERQLEAAAKDCYDRITCNRECPMFDHCREIAGGQMDWADLCKRSWRKRWEGMAK